MIRATTMTTIARPMMEQMIATGITQALSLVPLVGSATFGRFVLDDALVVCPAFELVVPLPGFVCVVPAAFVLVVPEPGATVVVPDEGAVTAVAVSTLSHVTGVAG